MGSRWIREDHEGAQGPLGRVVGVHALDLQEHPEPVPFPEDVLPEVSGGLVIHRAGLDQTFEPRQIDAAVVVATGLVRTGLNGGPHYEERSFGTGLAERTGGKGHPDPVPVLPGAGVEVGTSGIGL